MATTERSISRLFQLSKKFNCFYLTGQKRKFNNDESNTFKNKNFANGQEERNLDALIGVQTFSKIAQNKFFVDKSLFLEIFLNGPPYLIVTAPRRFGKSTILDMVKCFCEMETKNGEIVRNEETYELFASLKIGKKKDIMSKHFSKYPVIYVDMKILYGYDSFESLLENFTIMVQDSYKMHERLLPHLDPIYKSTYELIVNPKKTILKESEAITALLDLSEMLSKHFNSKCIVLIDEVDAPINSVIFRRKNILEDFDDAFEFLGLVFSSLLKGRLSEDYISKALITGCQYLGGIFSPVPNNVLHKSFSDRLFSNFYGFTQKEVSKLCSLAEISEADQYKLEEYYNGYSNEVYCNWSVVQYLSCRSFRPFWAEGGLDHIIHILRHEDVEITILNLINGGSITVPFREKLSATAGKRLKQLANFGEKINFFSKMKLDEDDLNLFFQYLFETGYLNVVGTRSVGEIILKVPNTEIREILLKELNLTRLLGKLTPDRLVTDLCDHFKEAIEKKDFSKLPDVLFKTFQHLRDQGISFEKEAPYHSYLLVYLQTKFTNLRTHHTVQEINDKGIVSCYIDIIMLDDDTIVEFKYVHAENSKKNSNEERMEATVKAGVIEALVKIHEKKYFQALLQTEKQVWVGICFAGNPQKVGVGGYVHEGSIPVSSEFAKNCQIFYSSRID